MSLEEEIKSDILSQRGKTAAPVGGTEAGDGAPAKKRHRRTKAEMEAYRQKKMAEEEARYLGQQKKQKRQKTKDEKEAVDAVPAPKKRRKKADAAAVPAAMPAPASPCTLEPMYMLSIPGLPDGDCICVCYCRGAVAKRCSK